MIQLPVTDFLDSKICAILSKLTAVLVPWSQRVHKHNHGQLIFFLFVWLRTLFTEFHTLDVYHTLQEDYGIIITYQCIKIASNKNASNFLSNDKKVNSPFGLAEESL